MASLQEKKFSRVVYSLVAFMLVALLVVGAHFDGEAAGYRLAPLLLFLQAAELALLAFVAFSAFSEESAAPATNPS